MGVDYFFIYRARIGTFVRLNKRVGRNLELQELEKKRRHRDVNMLRDGYTDSYSDDASYNGCSLQKYRLDQQLMVHGAVTFVVDIGHMLLLISGDIEENPGPLTQGELLTRLIKATIHNMCAYSSKLMFYRKYNWFIELHSTVCCLMYGRLMPYCTRLQ